MAYPSDHDVEEKATTPYHARGCAQRQVLCGWIRTPVGSPAAGRRKRMLHSLSRLIVEHLFHHVKARRSGQDEFRL